MCVCVYISATQAGQPYCQQGYKYAQEWLVRKPNTQQPASYRQTGINMPLHELYDALKLT